MPLIKGLLEIDGSTIIERSLALLGAFSDNIIISTNDPAYYYRYGVNMVGDVLDVRGPMTGIYSVMLSGSSDRYLVTACDMPFIREGLVRTLVSANADTDAVVPVFKGEPQPLCGIYSRRLLGRLYDNIIGKRCSISRFLDEIDTYFIDEERVRDNDPDGISFTNINTLADLREVEGGGVCLDSASRN
ncbi:MAG: molybdenum cofactor guanylyltransferase [Nitrospirota bacterium]|nr:MAG: molybdenum cofactor guanylyltransferase [Nitrospirota bacterium]